LKAVAKLLHAGMAFGLRMSYLYLTGSVLEGKKLFSSWANIRKTCHCVNRRLWRTLLATACWNKNSNILFLNYWYGILMCPHIYSVWTFPFSQRIVKWIWIFRTWYGEKKWESIFD